MESKKMDFPGVLMHQSITCYCNQCGYQNPDNAKFCLNCNSALESICPTCGQAVPPGSKFCDQCGGRLPGSQAAPAVPLPGNEGREHLTPYLSTALAEKVKLASVKLGGERREVTVLFLKVSNFTAAAHLLDSEDIYLLMDEAISLLVEVVHKYEGTIDTLILCKMTPFLF